MSVRRLWALAEEIDGLKKEVKEAEARGFKNGMLHAAEVLEDEAIDFTKLRYEEYQCLMELSEKLRKEVQGEH